MTDPTITPERLAALERGIDGRFTWDELKLHAKDLVVALRASQARESALSEVLGRAAQHLEYCGYGDDWERERAIADGLPEKIASALARYQTTRPVEDAPPVKSVECPICVRKFANAEDLGRHNQDKHGIACSDCERRFSSREAYAAHRSAKHPAALHELPREFDGKRVSAGATSAKAEAR